MITYANTPSALRLLHLVNDMAPTLPVIVRSHDDSDLDQLKKAGAAEVVPELMEGSLMLASHALIMMGVPLRRVVHRVQAAREERYASLRGYFHGSSDAGDDAELERLHTVTVGEDAHCVGLPLSTIDVAGCGAFVTAIRRARPPGSHARDAAGQRRRGGAARHADAVAKAETLLLK